MKSRRRETAPKPSTFALPATFPVELWKVIVDQIAGVNIHKRTRARLARVSRSLYELFVRELKSEGAKELLARMLKGLPNKVMKMVNADTELLRIKAAGVSLVGDPVKGTAYQVALGLNYYLLYKQMEPLFEKISNGAQERKNQLREQFPDEVQTEYDFAALFAVIAADPFAGERADKETYKKIKEFQDFFNKKFMNAEKKGIHLDLQIFIDAGEVYKNNFAPLTRFQREFYSSYVLGFLQYHFPVSAAQACCQGLDKVNANKRLTQKLHTSTGEHFFWRNERKRRGLGYNYFVNGVYPCTLESFWNPGDDNLLEEMKTYQESLVRNLQESKDACEEGMGMELSVW